MAHRIPQALLSLLLANIIYYPGDGTQNPPGTVEPAVSYIIYYPGDGTQNPPGTVEPAVS